MPDYRSPLADQTFRAQIGERAFEVALHDGTVTVDGTPVAASFAPVGDGSFSLLIEGRSVPVVVERAEGGLVRVTLDGHLAEVRVKDEQALLLERFGLDDAEAEAEREVRAPMPGLVLKVLVAVGDAVAAGDALVVLEAMKMENELRAPASAVVKAIHVQPGDAVGKNAPLIDFEA